MRAVLHVLTVFICLLGGLLSLSGDSSAQQRIKIAYCQNCAPFQMRDELGQPDGIIIDLWLLWQQRTGVRIDWQPATWSETLRLVKEGEADVHAGLFHRPARAKFLDYGVPVLATDTTAFLNRNLPTPDQITNLRAYRIGVLAGDAVESFLQDELGPNSVVAYETYDPMMADLADESILGFAADTETGLLQLDAADMSASYPPSRTRSSSIPVTGMWPSPRARTISWLS